ncbi:MAG: hypothetical protein NTW07_03030 [candidate division Zixibacteria bacterium]|nr:hypothetical protein [candidate division Zixibacteria bacterium]
MRGVKWLSVLAPMMLTLACSSVHIKTGPPTDADLVQDSEDRGSRMKAEWSNKLQMATPVQQASIMRGFIDSTTARFLRFGSQVAEMWRNESDRRGAQLSADEVQQVVERSNQFDLPLLEAYDDILEFGVDLIVDSRFFDSPVTDKLINYRDLYYDVYSAAFYPSGGLEDYERQLSELEAGTRQTSDLLAEELRRYQ